MLDKLDGWISLVSLILKSNISKEKENRMVDALSRSMKVIHLEDVSTYEIDVKERVKSAQETYAFFQDCKIILRRRSHRVEV
jgi:hypothetical protein